MMMLQKRTACVFAATVAATLSGLMLVITYPGNLSPDSITSWGEAASNVYANVKPPLVGMIQRGVFLAAGDIQSAVGVFSFIQGYLFWLSIFTYIIVVSPNALCGALFCTGACALYPLWAYTTQHWTDVWVVIFGIFGLAAFERLRQLKFRDLPCLVLAVACFFLAASARHSVIAVLPICLFPLVRFLGESHGVRVSRAVVLSCGVVVALMLSTKLWSQLPNVKPAPSMLPVTFLNPLLGTIAHSKPGVREEILFGIRPAFDSHFSPGRLDAAVKAYDAGFMGHLMWGEAAILPFEKSIRADFIIPAAIRAALFSPGAFVRHKVVASLGQLSYPAITYPYDWGVWTNELGIKSTPILPGANARLRATLEGLSTTLLYKHWFMLLVGCAAFGIGIWIGQAAVVMPFLFGVLQGLPYIVFETGWEWRYLMPSYVAFFLCAVSVLARAVSVGRGARLIQLAQKRTVATRERAAAKF
jgi:hypothetical protein